MLVWCVAVTRNGYVNTISQWMQVISQWLDIFDLKRATCLIVYTNYSNALSTMAGKCDICNKRIALHSHPLGCSVCERVYHIKCLPFVSKTDSIYVNKANNDWLCIRCAEEELPFNNIDEDDYFHDALCGFWFDLSKYPMAELRKKIFVAFEINADHSHHLSYFQSFLQMIQTPWRLEVIFKNCLNLSIWN